MRQEDKDQIKKLIDTHVSQLAEHVDCIQVFVLKHDDEGGNYTLSYEKGAGNFYGRFGQVAEWLTFQDEYQRAEARRRDDADHDP